MALVEDSSPFCEPSAGTTNFVGSVGYADMPNSASHALDEHSIYESIEQDKLTDKVDIGSTAEANDVSDCNTKKRISFEDFIDLNDIVFEWSDSYDTDWKRLEKILAPSMMVDYSIVGHEQIDDMPAVDFVGMMSSVAFLGNPLIKTQHLMGARKFEYLSDTEIIGHHQIRAAHQRYAEDGKTVVCRGHGHSFIGMRFKKIAGTWKLAGLRPQIYWNEKDFDMIFLQLKGQR